MKRTAPRTAAKKSGAATKKAGARTKRAGVEGKKTGAAETARLAKALAAAEAERDAALAREAAAAERQAATAEILRTIAATPGEAEATLRKICETTARLFAAAGVALRIAEGDEFTLYIGVGRGAEELTAALYDHPAARPTIRARTVPGVVVRENRQVHIRDLDHLDPEMADWPGPPIARAAGIRTLVGTPLRREGRAIGALQVYRDALQPFDAAELHLLQSFADQAVIAIENARLLGELRESLERQTATSEVLGVISSSPGELRPVFETMLANATRLCEAPMGWLFLRDGEAFDPAATVGVPPGRIGQLRGWRPHPAGAPARALATKTTVHVHDMRTEPEYQMGVEAAVGATDQEGMRSVLSVPLVRENEAFGIFLLYRQEVMPFSDKQIELVENFSKQAVIAIENARLLTELRESLARQTATAEVLSVISSSPGDLQPVFDAMLRNAMHICEAHMGFILRLDHDVFIPMAQSGVPPALAEYLHESPSVQLRPGSAVLRMAQSKATVQVPDAADLPSYRERASYAVALVELGRARTTLFVPMLREGEVIGSFTIYRPEVRPFDAKQVALVENLTDQAMIAIENARLLTELRESLDRQTATADILRVIASTPGDPTRALDTIAATAVRMFNAQSVHIRRVEDNVLRVIAAAGSMSVAARGAMPDVPLDRALIAGICVRENRQIHLEDVTAEPTVSDAPIGRLVQQLGVRTQAYTPLTQEGNAIGVMIVSRNEVRPFRPDELKLMRGFADQAVIAIENARLLTELRESLDRQTAMAEVLGVISSSPGDLQPVFDAMLANAARICQTPFGSLLIYDGDVFKLTADIGDPEAFIEYWRQGQRPQPGTGLGRLLETRQAVHIHDIRSESIYAEHNPERVSAVDVAGIRTAVFVPMLKEGEVIGAFVLERREVRPFAENQIELVENFAAQAVIAIENARLLREIKEALANQTASAEVLRTIADTPAEAGRALDTIAEVAARLFDAASVNVLRLDGNVLRHTTASFGRVAAGVRASVPEMALDSSSVAGLALLERRQLAFDNFADPEMVRRFPAVMAAVAKIAPGGGSVVATPLLREGQAVGAIVALRDVVRPFTEKELAQLRNFADQAVIAIENARLLGEIKEALANQTASAEVLRTIAGTPAEAGRALDTIAEVAARLFDAASVSVLRLDGNVLRHAASFGRLADSMRAGVPEIALDSSSGAGTALLERRQLAFENFADPEVVRRFPSTMAAAVKIAPNGGSEAVTPLLREGQAAGAIVALRDVVRPFTEQELAQLRNFADQAVIAIENARLLTELRESLDRQTAMAEVLGVISASPGEMRPVFEAILANATRLCEATQGVCFTYDGARFHLAASLNAPPGFADPSDAGFVLPPESNLGRMAASGEPVQELDLAASPSYRNRLPAAVLAVEAAGIRTALHVPLVKDGAVVGAIVVYRNEVRAFDEKHVALVQNFAAQAVIAIENARLLNEIREALERQTATAEILRVIASTPGDAQRALNAIAETTARLFAGADSWILTVEDDRLRYAAIAGTATTPLLAAVGHELPLDSSNVPGMIVLECRQIHIPDLDHIDPSIAHSPGFVPLRAAGRHVALGTPLMREGRAIGVLGITRSEAKPFDEQELAQIANFADQAVIAIENARLLNELRESLDRQTAMAEVLRVISSSPGELDPVFQAIVANAARICETELSSLQLHDGQNFKLAALHGVMPAVDVEWRAKYPQGFSGGPKTITGQVATARRTIHIADYSLSEAYAERDPLAVASVEHIGIRTVLGVPMVKDDRFLGLITVFRQEVRPFTDKQIELVENFAAQAVIAIENARLLNEIRESLERQTATAEILRVIASTPGDSQRALDTIAETTARLFAGADVSILTVEGDSVRHAAVAGTGATRVLAEVGRELPLDSSNLPGTVVLERRQIHVPDLDHVDPSIIAPSPGFVPLRAAGRHVVLGTPLMREGRAIGALMITRSEAKPFDEQELAQIANFADQAVIAIENARLLNELRESLDRQTAMAEVLRVISSSPGELDPVFQAIVANAARICETELSCLQLYDGQNFKIAALHGAARVPEISRQPQGFSGGPKTITGQVAATRRTVHIADYSLSEAYAERDPLAVASVEHIGIRTVLGVPMVKDDRFLGLIAVFRQEVRPFTEKQIELVENFAAQAVIAIENARLLNELRARTDELARRQAELRVTFDNMGDGVIMFDGEHRLVSWNRNLQQILDLPDAFFAAPKTFHDYITYLIERGEFGAVDLETELQRYADTGTRPRRVERTRPDGRVLEIRNNPVPGGGFVAIYSDVTERKDAEEQIRAARDAAEKALGELKAAQANLIQAEKMASLGQLTAGIAHEIKNPLNFVNNFAGLSVELLDELKAAAQDAIAVLDEQRRAEIDEVVTMLTSNLEKIAEHGRRADGIVKSMLAHSRGSSGERQSVNINALVEESLNLAYHGARAQDQNFNVTLERDLDAALAPIEVVPQDMTRVFLNLFGNGFYAANKRRAAANDAGFKPVLKVTTRERDGEVAISIRDNGIGIPPEIREKLFEPFFTTKPTGEGTGLGLSISYEIVTQQHGGTIEVESEVGAFTEFTVRLPRRTGAQV